VGHRAKARSVLHKGTPSGVPKTSRREAVTALPKAGAKSEGRSD
jgi:hypothetical protein